VGGPDRRAPGPPPPSPPGGGGTSPDGGTAGGASLSGSATRESGGRTPGTPRGRHATRRREGAAHGTGRRTGVGGARARHGLGGTGRRRVCGALHEHERRPVGAVAWADLTVADAPAVRDFYAAVCGWTPTEVAMGDYADYAMAPEGGDPVAGICHARGENAGMPAQWILYVTVENLDRSLAECAARGGALVMPVRDTGQYGPMAVVRAPHWPMLAILQGPSPG